MQWGRRPRLAVLLIVGLLAAMMMLSACGSGRAAEPAGEAIGVEMLPAGLGRGFPEVVVLAEDNRGPKVGEDHARLSHGLGRRQPHQHRRSPGATGDDQFLGDLVSSLPQGDAGHHCSLRGP